MKVIIQYVFIVFIAQSFCQEDDWEKSRFTNVWNSIFHRMTFREPIAFTPFEVKVGYLNYGGKNYWSGAPYNTSKIVTTDSPVLLDSTQYQFNSIDALTNRQGLFIEVDLFRTNLPHYIMHQNYIDLQIGLGFQYTDFSSNPNLPSDVGKEWDTASSTGDYYFHPRSFGLNINTSLGWQLLRSQTTYIYHSFGFNSLLLYESEGGDQSLTGTGLSESFGIGTKYIFNQIQGDFSYTVGIEAKWNRLYMSSAVSPNIDSPIHGIDLRASGIFLTTGIIFGGKHTDGDIAYSYMMKNDFISAAEKFEYFLIKERRHGKRKKAFKMLQYCQSQIPYQQVNYGVEDILQSDYTEAVEWFKIAETKADDDLKIEIQSYRKNIASQILDSVQNNKNIITIAEAEKLTIIALELLPDNKRADQILAGLYFDKGILNTDIGNYSDAIGNYYYAIELYPPMESIVLEKINRLINSFIEDAFFAAKDNELHLVINSLKTIIELKPELTIEWDSYIAKLEARLGNKEKNDGGDNYAEEYIETRQQETIPDYSQILQLGMTYEEVKIFWGKPQFIDEINDDRRHFEMWTYSTESNISRLYFEENKLVRIEK